MYEIVHEKRKQRLQILGNGDIGWRFSLKTFHKLGNVWKLVLDEKKMGMLQILDDELDRIGIKQNVLLSQRVGRRLKLMHHLLQFQSPTLANLLKSFF